MFDWLSVPVPVTSSHYCVTSNNIINVALELYAYNVRRSCQINLSFSSMLFKLQI